MSSHLPIRALRAGFSPLLPRQRHRILLLAASRRAYRPATAARLPYKDDQDRQSLKPRKHEGSQGLDDDQVAADLGGTAFGKNSTGPGTETETAKRESGAGDNPLELSGANQELSKPQGDDAAPEKAGGTDKKARSGPGTSKKGGKAV